MENVQVALREANSNDVSFIFNAWLKSYRSSPYVKFVNQQIYFAGQHKLIENLIKVCKVIIACNPEDSEQIYGFMVAEKIESILCIHYIYVKQPFRALGIGKLLLNSVKHDINNPCIYTHFTVVGGKLAEKYNIYFHPYVLLNR